jgi:phospholipid/cholesterol/gamma-HCH transport system substrate-binding protein
MENRSHALFAGLFLLILGVSAVAALWWFSGRHEESARYIVETRDNVTGLNAQAQVRYRGIRVGRVESIRLDPDDPRTTLIEISLPMDIPVTRGTVARLNHQGVTGIAHILLEDEGKDAARLPGGARIAMRDSLVRELTDVGGEVLRQTRDLLVGMNDLLRAENRQAVSQMLAHLEASSRDVREMSDRLRQVFNPDAIRRIDTMLVHFEMSSRNVLETSNRLRQVLNPDAIRRIDAVLAHSEQTVAQAAPFFAEARGLVARLGAASDRFERMLGDANSGGVEALLVRLNVLTTEFTSTTHQLNRVLGMLERSPESLIFGRDIAPGPGEKGFMAPSSGGAIHEKEF